MLPGAADELEQAGRAAPRIRYGGVTIRLAGDDREGLGDSFLGEVSLDQRAPSLHRVRGGLLGGLACSNGVHLRNHASGPARWFAGIGNLRGHFDALRRLKYLGDQLIHLRNCEHTGPLPRVRDSENQCSNRIEQLACFFAVEMRSYRPTTRPRRKEDSGRRRAPPDDRDRRRSPRRQAPPIGRRYGPRALHPSTMRQGRARRNKR